MNKKLVFEEKKLARKIHKQLKKVEKEIVARIRALDTTKSSLDEIFYDIPIMLDPMIKDIITSVSNGYDIGVQTVAKKYMLQEILDFNKIETSKQVYLANVRELHLSTRRWSITHTTNKNIRLFIANWLEQWISYTDIADRIVQEDPFTFSLSRARMIATNEMGKWYVGAWYNAMKQIQDWWYIIRKRRLTAWDHKVTPTHTQNAEDWRIPLNDTFSWTGDTEPPASDNPRCRCDLEYEVNGES